MGALQDSPDGARANVASTPHPLPAITGLERRRAVRDPAMGRCKPGIRRRCAGAVTSRRAMVLGPLIGITTYLVQARWASWDVPAAVLPAAYTQAVQAAGGLAVLLPPREPAAADEAVARLDGIILAGGEDIDPAMYGAARHPSTEASVPVRDRWERAVLGAALERDTPIVGVCRGMQMMNVYAGGTLIQHLPDKVGHQGHSTQPGSFAQHAVTTVPNTRTASLLPGTSRVMTHHHQAVDILGDGLSIAARAEDGTVEALEFAGHPFALGVQWHPEMSDDMRVLEALVAAAESHRSHCDGMGVRLPSSSTPSALASSSP